MPLRSRSYYFKILPNIYLWKHSKQCSKNLSCSSLSNVRSTQVLTWWSTRGSKMCWAQPWKIRSHTRVYLMKVKVAQSCPTLCDPMDYTVHRLLQARTLQWVAVPFSRRSSQPRVKARSPAFQVDSLPAEPQGKPYFSSNFDLSFQSQTPCGNFLHRIFFRFHLNCAHLNLILALGFTSSPDSSLKSSFLLF